MTKRSKQPEKLSNYEDVVRLEREKLHLRRQKLFDDNTSLEEFEDSKMGIALSGGGIRSATINLGILKTLNRFGLLKRADYLSTVSGGGYTGAYIQATLKSEGSYDSLFQKEHLVHMRSWGEYLLPGMGWLKRWNTLVLIVGFLVSLLMSWSSPIILIALFYILYGLISQLFNFESFESVRAMFEQINVVEYGLLVLGSVVLVHFALNLIMEYRLGISRKFNNAETFLVLLGMVWYVLLFVLGLKEGRAFVGDSNTFQSVFAAVLLVLLGFVNNPNAISFHRFYRTQLADAFLHFSKQYKNIRLRDLFKVDSERINDYMAPYPLINTCLNLQSTRDKSYSGTKTNDYFLLSPLYCGAKLSNYVDTAYAQDYKEMTLPAATTISAAAVNPGMGIYSNKLLSIFMTVFNARLGFWTHNPLKKGSSSLVWWPFYFFYELFSLIGTDNRKLNISDGGHIENLGVYELLRRQCRLIIAIDAGADPTYAFTDLENLTIRARNELGVELQFRPGHIPEQIIRPKPSIGYSQRRYCLADIIQLWEEIIPLDDQNNPILSDKNKTIEVLINYKDFRIALAQLDQREGDWFVEVMEGLQVQEYTDQAMDILTNKERLEATFASIDTNENIRNVLRSLVHIFEGLKTYLDKTLPKKIKDPERQRAVLRSIIRSIDKRVKNKLKTGTLVYVKSSVTAPESKLNIQDKTSLEYKTYKYKVYHPNFPHEPTSDQFFDEVQWESYFQVGQYIGAEVLGARGLLGKYLSGEWQPQQLDFNTLIQHFDEQEAIQHPIVPKEVPRTTATAPPPEAPAMEVPVAMDSPSPVEAAPVEAEEATAEQEVSTKVVIGRQDSYSM
ncbi:MAG: hypothetical protein AAFV95_19975 [Bacteroidota bacterium]